MKKRILSVILCMAILLTTFMSVPFSVSAQTTDTVTTGFMSGDEDKYPFAMVNGVKYTLLENYCMVTGYDYDDVRENIVIEKEVEGLPVTYIWEHAFYHNQKIKSVYIPNTITGADVCAFQECSNLRTVEFESGSKFKNTFEWCFSGCTSLESVHFPASLEVLGQFIFEGCTNLKSVTFDKNSNLKCIAGEAFMGCELLETIDIPASTKEIHERAFENCYSLSKVELHEGLEKIGEKAFFNCYSLPEIYVPESVEEIGAYAFACFEYEGEVYSYSDFTVIGSPDSLADEYAEMYMVKYEKALPAPKLTSISNTDSGVKLSFEKLSGVSGYYRVYRKTAGTSWTKLADITSASYTDTTATAGTKYTYTVKFIGNDGTNSLYDKTGLSITRMKTPSVTKIENVENGAKITFSAVAGATKYRVYVKTSNDWKGIGDTSSTSIVHTDAVSGTSYTYTVKAFDSSGASSSFNSTGWSNKFIATPFIKNAEVTNSGVKLTWDKVAGAENYKYRVFIKNGSSWKTLANVSSETTSYVDKTATVGNTYTYTIRIVDSNNKYVSDYEKEGFTINFLETPQITSFENVKGGTVISWNEVEGAKKYRLYVKKDGSWTKIADVSGTSYTHTDLEDSTEYTYTIRCITEDSKTLLSGFDSTGFTNLYEEPKVTVLTGDADLDGEISVLDASLIQLYLVGKKELTDDALVAADADLDGEISVLDASLIQLMLVGKK